MKQTSSETKNKSYRDDILKYALKTYETIPDYPWMSLPGYAVRGPRNISDSLLHEIDAMQHE